MNWRDDIKEFVFTLDPDNLVLPDDFDPLYEDPKYKFNTAMAWMAFRPGTPFIPELFVKLDVVDDIAIAEPDRSKCLCKTYFISGRACKPDENDYRFKPVMLSFLEYWIIFRPNEPIPNELLYERYIFCNKYNCLKLWIMYRDEPIPKELYDVRHLDFNTSERSRSETLLTTWVLHRRQPIPNILLEFLGHFDNMGRTSLITFITSSVSSFIDIPTPLLLERNIKRRRLYRSITSEYPIDIWKTNYPHKLPPIGLYPDGLLPNLFEINTKWRENIVEFVKWLNPHTPEFPNDFDPCYVHETKRKKYLPANYWVLSHPNHDIPEAMLCDPDVFLANNVESPLITWIRTHRDGQIPEYLTKYIGMYADTGSIESHLMEWIGVRDDDIPDVLWVEVNYKCTSQFKNAALVWICDRRGPLPEILFPLLVEHDKYKYADPIFKWIKDEPDKPIPYELLDLYYENIYRRTSIRDGLIKIYLKYRGEPLDRRLNYL